MVQANDGARGEEVADERDAAVESAVDEKSAEDTAESAATKPGEEPAARNPRASAKGAYGDVDDEPDAKPAEGSDGTSIRDLIPSLGRPLAIGGGTALLLIWTMLLWQLSGSFSELSASAQTIAHRVESASTVASDAVSGAVTPEDDLASSTHADGDLPVNLESTVEPIPTLEPAPQPEPTPDTSLLFGEPIVTHGLDRWNCTDFETWEQALSVYEASVAQSS